MRRRSTRPSASSVRLASLEEGGSLTIVATVTSETGSPIDELILEEFREPPPPRSICLDISPIVGCFPAIDPSTSFTRAEDRLFDPDEADTRRQTARLRRSGRSDHHDEAISWPDRRDRIERRPAQQDPLGRTAHNRRRSRYHFLSYEVWNPPRVPARRLPGLLGRLQFHHPFDHRHRARRSNGPTGTPTRCTRWRYRRQVIPSSPAR